MSKGFQCKQFYIAHDKCAMKITEMACLLGAFCPIPFYCKHVLDIGCGTGLLSLMLAQRSNASITAIDKAPEAVLQATENCSASPFNRRIEILESDFTTFQTKQKFDLIICNPPFFSGQLKAVDPQKAMAWHDDHLPLTDLFKQVKSFLSERGTFVVLIPTQRGDDFIKEGKENNLGITQYFMIRHQENREDGFLILGFQHELHHPVHHRRITVRNDQKQYTPGVYEALKPFYLNL